MPVQSSAHSRPTTWRRRSGVCLPISRAAGELSRRARSFADEHCSPREPGLGRLTQGSLEADTQPIELVASELRSDRLNPDASCSPVGSVWPVTPGPKILGSRVLTQKARDSHCQCLSSGVPEAFLVRRVAVEACPLKGQGIPRTHLDPCIICHPRLDVSPHS